MAKRIEILSEAQRENVAKWVAALRGGEYPQAAGVLRGVIDYGVGGDAPILGYCCLGVFCDVMDPSGWLLDPRMGGPRHTLGLEGGGEFPSDWAMAEHLGMDDIFSRELAAMNDGDSGVDYDFGMIADAIEGYYNTGV